MLAYIITGLKPVLLCHDFVKGTSILVAHGIQSLYSNVFHSASESNLSSLQVKLLYGFVHKNW